MPDNSVPIESGLESLDYVAIALYMLVTFGISLWFGRKQKTVDDFFVGGRHMPWFAVGLSIMATLFSTLTYLGAPGEVIKNGVGMALGTLAVPFSLVVVFYVWIPFFMRLKVTSAYEYLEWRFNDTVRLIGASLFVLLRLGWMSMVIFAASMALDRVKGDDYSMLPGPDIYWWIAGVGLFAAIYTSVGGIQAMIWTDVLQCLLLLAGVLMAIFYVFVVDHTGPVDWWQTAATHAPQHTSPPIFTTDVMVRNTVVWVLVGNFFWTICTHGSDQVVLQRYFSTASLTAARRSYLINVFVDFGMTILLGMAGLALLSFYLKHGELLPEGWTAVGAADKLFPHFLGHQLPAGCAGLVMSAFICDAMQTLEAGANAITAVVSNDFVPATAPRATTHHERSHLRPRAVARGHRDRDVQCLLRGGTGSRSRPDARRDDAQILQPVRRPAGRAVYGGHVLAALHRPFGNSRSLHRLDHRGLLELVS